MTITPTASPSISPDDAFTLRLIEGGGCRCCRMSGGEIDRNGVCLCDEGCCPKCSGD